MATVARSRATAWWNPANVTSQLIVALLVMSWWKRLCCLAAGAGAIVLIVHLCGSVSFGLRNWRGTTESAPERASLFAQAWAAHDQAGMLRFVRPADEAKLQSWLSANPVPAQIADVPAANRDAKTISFLRDDTDGAVVKVRVAVGPAIDKKIANDKGAASDSLVLRMAWSYTGSHWLFSPDGASAVAPPPAGLSRPLIAPAMAAPPADNSPDWSETPRKPRPSVPGASRNVVIPSTVPPWARAR
jgi:hypothetical protein